MKKIKLYSTFLILFIFLAQGCKEDKLEPQENNATPPGQVSNIQVENQSGQAVIRYTLPSDQDLLYVKAVYRLASGVIREVKASYYTNSMILDGFGDTEEHEVSIYAVNRSETLSEPVKVIIRPLENPIWKVRKSLTVSPDFSGINIKASNPDKYDIAIEIMRKDSLGNWTAFPSIYTSAPKINETKRGLDTLQYSFGVTVRDRFMNYTDTVLADIVPYYEESLSKSLFRKLELPGDAKVQNPALGMDKIWDGNADHTNHNRLLTVTTDVEPQHITFDMGQSAKLSRIKIQNFGETLHDGNRLFYYRGQLRFFEIWGSENPSADGGWDGWTRLGAFECVKPSGLPYEQQSSEDWDKMVYGVDYLFDNSPKIRYIRIRSIENWEGTTWMEIQEVTLYGDNR